MWSGKEVDNHRKRSYEMIDDGQIWTNDKGKPQSI